MSVPAHVNGASHATHTIKSVGYEYLTTQNWQGISNYVDWLQRNNPYFKRPVTGAGNMGALMEMTAGQTYWGGYDYDDDFRERVIYPCPNCQPLTITEFHVVSPDEADHAAKMLIPQAILSSGSLFQMFWRAVGSGGTPPPPVSDPGGDHPDDNFDVSSRLIRLEELDPTKEVWKDLYGRTGIKKGYIGLSLNKKITELYQKYALSTSDEEFSRNGAELQAALKQAEAASKHTFEEAYYGSPDVALLSSGFVDESANLLLKGFKEPIREVKDSFNPQIVSTQPVLVIPSGAFYGMENSAFMKGALDEYVKNGGTLIVFAQQHGYEFGILPTPDGKPITAYGWQEDQSCFTNAVYIDTWHQMLAGQNRATPTLNVDGYFTGYPDNSTIILRRNANGQPALLMYDYGQGRVIVTSMYSDWAYGHGQASPEEVALIRDMLTWAKKPAVLPEIKPGETVSLTLTAVNSSGSDAASVKLQIYSPDRSTLLSEQTATLAILAGQSASLPVSFTSTSTLGIYHIDYILLDAAGNVIQPQAETDSGRFVVSNPPANPHKNPDFSFYSTTTTERVPSGGDATFTVHLWNNTTANRTITARYIFPHMYIITKDPSYGVYKNSYDPGKDDQWVVKTVTVPASGYTSFDHLVKNLQHDEFLYANFYDENGNFLGTTSRGVFVFSPSVGVDIQTDKAMYKKGETVNIALNLQNKQNYATATSLNVKISDSSNASVYNNTVQVNLAASGAAVQNMTFLLPAMAQGGSYIISVEAFGVNSQKIGGSSSYFELPLSQVSAVPMVPAVLTPGSNSISFTVGNIGKVDVSRGALDVTLKDPDGLPVANLSQPFTLNIGENKTIDFPLSIPALKFGNYTLTYSQSDETRTGKPANITIANAVVIANALDKPSYRIRETAGLTVNLTNTGKFNLDERAGSGVTVTVSVPDAGFTETRIISISPSPQPSPARGEGVLLTYSIPLPETMTIGQHDVNVTLELPSRSSLVQSTKLTIPQSLLTLGTVGTAHPTAGDTISVPVANIGGVDTSVQYKLSLYDAKAVLISEKSATETVQAGATLPLTLSIPSGTVDGGYNLIVNYKDTKTIKTEIKTIPLSVAGVKAALTVNTDKQAYLTTETISSLASLTNSGTPLQNGNLHLQVTTAGDSLKTKTWTSQYDFQQGVRNGVDTYDNPDNLQLIEISDDFNDGFINRDRWGLGVVGGTVIEDAGTVNMKTQASSGDSYYGYRYASEGLNGYWIEGDFDIQVDFSMPYSPSQNGWVYSPDVIFASGLIKVAYIYYSDWKIFVMLRDNNGNDTVVSSMVPMFANSGKFRFTRQGSTMSFFYWNAGLNHWEWNGNQKGISFETSSAPANIGLQNWTLNYLTTDTEIRWDNFKVLSQVYPKKGTSSLVYEAEYSVPWNTITWSSDTPLGTSIKLRTRTSETDAGLASAAWSDYITASGSAITSQPGRWIEVEATLETTNTNVTPVLHDVTVTYGNNPGDVLWQADVPVSQAQNAVSEMNSVIGTLGSVGKLYLQGSLTSGTGQTIASSEAAFYVANGNTALLFNTDKKIYKPGETVTVIGEVRNLAAVEATGLALVVSGQGPVVSQNLYTETFTVPAGGSHPFTFITTAGVKGKVNLAGNVVQNGSTLAEISEQYEVAAPSAVLTVSAPDVVGKEPFELDVEVKNTGKVDISGQWSVAGAYPEGKIAIPVTVTNTGQVDEQLEVNFQLSGQGAMVSGQTKTYYLPKAGSVTDTLYYDLTKGSYQLSAVSAQPSATAQASFSVAKENDVIMTVVGGQGSVAGLLPVSVNLTNNGWNTIEGSVKLQAIGNRQEAIGQEITVWSAEQNLTSLSPFASRLVPFNIDPSGIAPGTYNLEAVLYNNSGQQLAVSNQQLEIKGAIFQITQVPVYTTFAAGSEGSFTFKIKNTGNQEGEASFNLKVMDVLDQTRREWLKPGEEKELSFAFQVAEDLEEKDYFGEYRLKAGDSPYSTTASVNRDSPLGQVKFHVAGVNIAVNASLDKQRYVEGETARLTLVVSGQGPVVSGQNLFARVNYAGYEARQSFTIGQGQAQPLQFDIPLNKITGEKMFYGIYHESGRSIHLNSIYVYKAGDAISIMADKQVYNPGEMVTVTVGALLGAPLNGTMTLTGPGNYSETFAFNGSATKYIFLPLTMTAGTYKISASLNTGDSPYSTTASVNRDSPLSASHPIDVNGIQVKVKEATLDKAKYAATDTINLSLTVESNKDMDATLRTWVVDPSGTYTPAGELAISLTSSEPLLTTGHWPLTTSFSGIHRLVYGIYADGQPQGTAPTLLLSSGSEAFDVGDAVLMGLATDKTSYPTNTEPVNVTLTMYGSAAAMVELFVDGQSVNSEAVSLNGFMTKAVSIQPLAFSPGSHSIKAVLSAGGLTSVKETGIVYGSSLPDLTVVVSAQQSAIGSSNLITLTATVTNQGKTASTATGVAVYLTPPNPLFTKEGAPQAGELIATLPVPALAPGESTTVVFDWNVLGKAGVQTISAVVDPGNIVNEFNEFNNRSNTSITIPDVVLSLHMSESAFSSGDLVHIEGFATNLSAGITYSPVQVATTVVDPQGSEVFNATASIELLPSSVVSVSGLWDTKGMALGDYTITQSAVSGQQVLASDRKTISLNNTVPSCQVLAPLSGQTISGRYPVAWQARDADGNILVIDVAYSLDAGITWVYEATNKANDGTYSWDTSSLPDGVSYKIKIIAKDGTATASCESGIFATLNTGALKINSQPDGARVYIDGNYAYPGTYYGTTGINISQIRTGRHTLRLTHPGYIDHYQLIEIMPGAETQVTADLKPFVSVSYGNGVKVMSQGLPIDAGSYSVPVVIDWNMDGKKDLIAGNSSGQVLYYENTGTDSVPLFNSDPAVIFSGGQSISPFVIDWDNDGRADIIAGGVNGEVLLYKNSSQGSLSFEPGVTIARVNSSAIPFVIDWNEDNKKDLVIGGGDGTLNIYINQGTDSQPAFDINPGMTVLTNISSLSPFVVTDWDGNGTKDLIVGSGYGGIYVYPNQGTNASPSFGAGQPLTGITGPINPGGSSTPFIVDFNNDGLRDLITGNISGEVDLFIASEALVPAVIDLDPDTLSKKSKGQWVTCYIELPGGYAVEDVEISSLLLEGAIPAETKPVAVGDHDSDGISDLMVKFDRQRLQNLLSKGDKVKVSLTGRLKDGRNIRGEDYIRVTE